MKKTFSLHLLLSVAAATAVTAVHASNPAQQPSVQVTASPDGSTDIVAPGNAVVTASITPTNTEIVVGTTPVVDPVGLTAVPAMQVPVSPVVLATVAAAAQDANAIPVVDVQQGVSATGNPQVVATSRTVGNDGSATNVTQVIPVTPVVQPVATPVVEATVPVTTDTTPSLGQKIVAAARDAVTTVKDAASNVADAVSSAVSSDSSADAQPATTQVASSSTTPNQTTVTLADGTTLTVSGANGTTNVVIQPSVAATTTTSTTSSSSLDALPPVVSKDTLTTRQPDSKFTTVNTTIDQTAAGTKVETVVTESTGIMAHITKYKGYYAGGVAAAAVGGYFLYKYIKEEQAKRKAARERVAQRLRALSLKV